MLQERNILHQVGWYLEGPLDEGELTTLLQKLKMQPSELVRKSEPVYKEQFAKQSFTEKEWLEILVNNPLLIERQIVENGEDAVIARPEERIFEIISGS